MSTTPKKDGKSFHLFAQANGRLRPLPDGLRGMMIVGAPTDGSQKNAENYTDVPGISMILYMVEWPSEWWKVVESGGKWWKVVESGGITIKFAEILEI